MATKIKTRNSLISKNLKLQQENEIMRKRFEVITHFF